MRACRDNYQARRPHAQNQYGGCDRSTHERHTENIGGAGGIGAAMRHSACALPVVAHNETPEMAR
jgi:hypothetical protein